MTDLLHIPTTAHDLAPGDLLRTDSSRHQLIRVTDGVLYVQGDDDDGVLLPGYSITIAAGTARRVWNAGDEPARVMIREPETGCPESLHRYATARAA